MPSVSLPDGKQLEVEPSARARDVVQSIGPRLARAAVAAKLDGEVVGLDSPVDGGGSFEVLTKDSPDGLEVHDLPVKLGDDGIAGQARTYAFDHVAGLCAGFYL